MCQIHCLDLWSIEDGGVEIRGNLEEVSVLVGGFSNFRVRQIS